MLERPLCGVDYEPDAEQTRERFLARDSRGSAEFIVVFAGRTLTEHHQVISCVIEFKPGVRFEPSSDPAWLLESRAWKDHPGGLAKNIWLPQLIYGGAGRLWISLVAAHGEAFGHIPPAEIEEPDH